MMHSRRRSILITVSILLVFAAGLIHLYARRALHGQLLVDARAAVERNDYAEAELLARRLISAHAHQDDARLIAGAAAMKLGANERALAYVIPLLDGRDENARIAIDAAADIRWEQGNATETERLLRKLLDIEPDPIATARLAHLLTLTGRHWESGPFRLALMRFDHFQFDDLLLWGNTRALIETEELASLRRASPEDPLLKLGAASIAVRKNETAAAESLLSEVMAARPDLVEAHVLRGMLLSERPGTSVSDMAAWNHALPASAEEHPEVWMVRGLWTRQHDNAEVAARCFWEAVRRSPNHQLGNYQMALAMKQLGREDAEFFSQRANRLEELERTLGVLNTQRSDLVHVKKAVELTELLGRLWEAWGWSRVALLIDGKQAWAIQVRDRAAAALKADPPQVIPAADPGQRFDYSQLPLPDWLATHRSAATR